MKIHIINNDEECVAQLKSYFFLLLKADKIQSRLEKKISKIIHNKPIQISLRMVKKYHKLNSIGRNLDIIKQNINYYLIQTERAGKLVG